MFLLNLLLKHPAPCLPALAVNGPTTAGGRLPPFEWRGEAAETVAHIGQPARFDYEFELMTPADELWGGATASAAVS